MQLILDDAPTPSWIIDSKTTITIFFFNLFFFFKKKLNRARKTEKINHYCAVALQVTIMFLIITWTGPRFYGAETMYNVCNQDFSRSFLFLELSSKLSKGNPAYYIINYHIVLKMKCLKIHYPNSGRLNDQSKFTKILPMFTDENKKNKVLRLQREDKKQKLKTVGILCYLCCRNRKWKKKCSDFVKKLIEFIRVASDGMQRQKKKDVINICMNKIYVSINLIRGVDSFFTSTSRYVFGINRKRTKKKLFPNIFELFLANKIIRFIMMSVRKHVVLL